MPQPYVRYRLRVTIEQIRPHLWHWTAPHPEWTPKNRGESGLGWDEIVSSYALIADGAFVLVDPQVPEDEDDAAELWRALDADVEGHGPPAILITIHWHVRSAPEIAERYGGTTIWAPESAAKEIAKRAPYTDTFGTGDELPGGVRAYDLARFEEAVLELPAHNALVFGDIVLDGPRICPPSWLPKGTTIDELADEIRPLLKDKELLLLTHGGPTPAEDLEV
jgi:glyoxylase-like metal-dependent hydrolase (beta-lactamase superfamily II)